MDAEDIAKVLASHQLHESMNLCLGCQWRPRADGGSLRIQHRDHLAAVLAPLVEQAKREGAAEGSIEGQMKHITAEMIRGDQPLDEKEEFIADLRARLSHTEAERDQLIADMRTLADEWVEAERAADEYGPKSAFTGYDCAEMLCDRAERAAQTPRDGGGS